MSKKIFLYLTSVSFLISIILLLNNRIEVIIAWWLLIICFLPAIIYTRFFTLLSVKVLVFTAFITQSVTMLLHYLRPEDYIYQDFRPFLFTGRDSFGVLYKIGFFLFLVLIFSKVIQRLFSMIFKFKNQPRGTLIIEKKSNLISSDVPNRFSKLLSLRSSILIILVIIFMIPINLWMFEMGIGLTGVEPPLLPYRLSGFCTYLVKFFVPAILALLYLRTKRKSLLLILAMGIYSVFLGISTVSRGTAIFVILTPWIFSYIDRRWVLFISSTLIVLLGYALTTASRTFVFLTIEGSNSFDTHSGLLSVLLNSINLVEFKELWVIFPQIIGRFESFASLFLASKVDASNLGGGWVIWLKSVCWNLTEIDNDAIHLETLGHTVPEGIYNVSAGLLSNMMWALSDSLFFFIPYAFLSAFMLVFFELALRRLEHRYFFNSSLSNFMIVLFSLAFFSGPGYPIMIAIFIFALFASLLPYFSILNLIVNAVGVTTNKH